MSTTLSALLKRHSKMHQIVVSENVQFGVLVDTDNSSHDQGSASAGFKLISKNVRLDVRQNDCYISITASDAGTSPLRIAIWNKADLEFSRAGTRSLVIQIPEADQRLGEAGGSAVAGSETSERGSFLVRFECESDARSVYHALASARDETNASSKVSVFERRTEASSAEQYFQFYSLLSQQQNMLQDYVRTSTYQRAILDNEVDFRDKVVMDVGAGSGILSFFAVQAGARRVYAVEASSTAQHCEALVNANQLAGRIVVVRGKLEEIELDEPVDVLVSEPLGYMLFNERMLETFLHAKKFLRTSRDKPRTNSVGSTYSDADDVHPFAVGRMFPTRAELFIAPFTDDALFSEVQTKANFWYQQSFHGCVDLTALRDAALHEYFRQPVVDTFDVRVCCAPPQKHTVDFASATETDLTRIDVPLSFVASQSATVHGLAFWFDVAFVGSAATVWLSTSPTEPLTHWYQVRCLVPTPIFVHAGQTLTGRLLLCANARQSYDVDIELVATLNLHANTNAPTGTAYDTVHTIRSRNTLDLKNPLFRYTGVPTQPPPGSHTQQATPTELYWQSAQNTSGLQYDAVNGAVAFPVGVQPAGFQTVAALPNGSGASQQLAPNNASCDALLDPTGNGSLHQTQSRPGTAVQQFTV